MVYDSTMNGRRRTEHNYANHTNKQKRWKIQFCINVFNIINDSLIDSLYTVYFIENITPCGTLKIFPPNLQQQETFLNQQQIYHTFIIPRVWPF